MFVVGFRSTSTDIGLDCNVTGGPPDADHDIAQRAILVGQLARALAERLCEQLPPHRTYRSNNDDVDHGAEIDLRRLTRDRIQTVVRHVPVRIHK